MEPLFTVHANDFLFVNKTQAEVDAFYAALTNQTALVNQWRQCYQYQDEDDVTRTALPMVLNFRPGAIKVVNHFSQTGSIPAGCTPAHICVGCPPPWGAYDVVLNPTPTQYLYSAWQNTNEGLAYRSHMQQSQVDDVGVKVLSGTGILEVFQSMNRAPNLTVHASAVTHYGVIHAR